MTAATRTGRREPRTAGQRRARVRATPALAALALGGLVGGCATAPPGTDATAGGPDASALHGELAVYAAASLTAVFDELAAGFAAEHPGVDVRPIVYDGSSTLATQLIEGAPADVLATADEASLARVADAGLLAEAPAVFATNTLVIAVPTGNPAGIGALADLAGGAARGTADRAAAPPTVVLCDTEVPCGRASARLLDLAGVVVTPVSLEHSVTAVLTKVAAGEADAGLVYATDVVGRADVEAIVPARAQKVVNRYPIAALDGASHPDVARAFVEHVRGERGQAVLARHGFGAP